MQYSERRDLRHAALTAIVLLVVVALQAMGFVTVRLAAKRASGTARTSESVGWAHDAIRDGVEFAEGTDAGPAITGDLELPK
jgi:hypothetical protein